MDSVTLADGCWEHLHLLTKKIVFYRLNRIVWMSFLIVLLCNLFVVARVSSNSDTLNLTFIYSGDEQGLLGAHGCGQQMGGLDRRHTLIKSLFEKRKNVLFSRRVIEDGELNTILFYSPRESDLLSEKKAVQRAKAEFEKWKINYAKEKARKSITTEQDKLNIQAMTSYFFDDYVQYLVKGKAIYEEQNIAFQVKQKCDETQPLECFLYRLRTINRYNEYEHPELLNNRYLQQVMPTEIKYHNLKIVNHEYRVSFWASPERGGISLGSIRPAHSSGIHLPFHLIGRSLFPVQIRDVVAHSWEKTTEHKYYTVEYIPRGIKSPPGIRGTIKIWLDPLLDFCVVRDESYFYTTKGKIKKHETLYTEFKEYPGGIWYPTRIESSYYPNPKASGIRFSYIIREADFNIGMPLDFFDLDPKEAWSTGIKIAPMN